MFLKGTIIKPLKQKAWLATPTMHGPELDYIKEAYETNWMSTVGNILHSRFEPHDIYAKN